MRGQLLRAAWIVLFAPTVLAYFDTFYWAGNGGNSSVLRTCAGSPYECAAPNICATETLTKKTYCCTTGSSDAPCWIGSPTCGANANTHDPSAGQQACAGQNGTGTVNYCCLQNYEQCIPTSNYFNVCWSTAQNTIASLNVSRLNQTYSSLSSASPSATAFTIASTALVQLSSTSSGASSTSSTSATSTAPAASSSAPNHSGLSGGAIGGIVGGILGGLLLIALAAFLYTRRLKRLQQTQEHSQQYPQAPYPQAYGHNTYDYQPAPQMAPAELSYGQPVVQKYAQSGYETPEMPRNERPVELDGRY